LGGNEFTPSTESSFLHLWGVKFLKRIGVLKNETFFSFISHKTSDIFHIPAFYFAVFGVHLFYPHKVDKRGQIAPVKIQIPGLRKSVSPFFETGVGQ